MKKLLKYKDFLGTTFLYNVKKSIKNGCSISIVLVLFLIVLILPNILVSNVERCFNYLESNMVYVHYNKSVNDILAKDPRLISIYKSKVFRTIDADAYTFKQKNDISTFTRSVFLNDDFDGIVISVKSKEDIDYTLLGKEISIQYSNNNSFEKKYITGKVVNFCFTDKQKEILPVYRKTTVKSYFLNEDFIDLSAVKFEDNLGYYALTYNQNIDESIDKMLYELLEGSNSIAVTPSNYTSSFTLINRYLNAFNEILSFLSGFSIMFLCFIVIILIFMVNIDFNDKEYEIKVRNYLGITKRQLGIQFILGALLKLIIYTIISLLTFSLIILLLNLSITSLNFSDLKINLVYFLFAILILASIYIIDSVLATKKIKN